MLVEARPLDATETSAFERRSHEALRYLGEPVCLFAATGEALLRNPAAIDALRRPGRAGPRGDQFLASSVDPATAARMRERVAVDEVHRADSLARTLTGERWFDTEVRRAIDAVTGKPKSIVFTCFNQDQHLDEVDWQNLNDRLRQNTVQEKLTSLTLDRLLMKRG